MSLETQIFEFDEFILDLPDRTLYRGGEIVNLSIKAFDLLRVLFENRPHVVEKKTLMEAVWPDSFVEEGNLTFTVSLLRRSLNDSKREPRIIETVHRRGYRFIADVRVNSASHVHQLGNSPAPNRKDWRGWSALAVGLAAVLCVGGFMLAGRGRSAPSLLSGPISMEKLSTSGKVAHAVISADGKYVIYTSGTGVDQQSVWLRQLDSGSNVEIIKPSDHKYLGLALSPDGNFMYFARTTAGGYLSIYRLSIFGGIPVKIADETEGWMSLSPDGNRIAFVRCRYTIEENCSLYIADALDGANERKLVTYGDPVRIGDNAFSPDGRSIAYAYGQSDEGEDSFRLAVVDVETGASRELSAHKFFNIKSVLWLPAESGWLIAANTKLEPDTPILHLPADGGPPVKLTNDSENYSGLSGTATGGALVATRVRRQTDLYVIRTEDGSERNLGGPVHTVTIAANNKIYYSSAASGNPDIWTANADGSDPTQITNDPGTEFVPLASPDCASIFFSSNRTGEPQIWRMKTDGGDQKQVTRINGGWPVFVTADASWLYYRHWARGTLWRVSTTSGEEMEVLPRKAYRFSVAPDGSAVLVSTADESAKVELVDLEKRELAKTFELPEKNAQVMELAWTGDGRSFLFLTRLADGAKEVWSQELAGGAPRRLKKLSSPDQVHNFSLAPDGQRFAVVQGGWHHDAVLITTATR